MEANPLASLLRPSLRFLLVAAWLILWLIVSTLALRFPEGIGLLSATSWECIRATCLVGLPVLLLVAVGLRWSDRISSLAHTWGDRLVFLLFLVAVCAINRRALWDGLHGSGDHMVHLTLGRLTEAMLYTQGTLRGWTSAWGTGFPLNELYPPGGNLLFVLGNALTLGFVSDERVYTWVVTLAYLGFGIGMFAVARQAFGRMASYFILLLLLLDGGNWYFTWGSVFDGGMWAIALGLGTSFYAMWLLACPGTLSRTGWNSLVACVAASLLLHPFFLFLMGFWFLVVVGVFLATRERTRSLPLGEGITRLLAFGLGYGLIAFWWAPFLEGRDWLFPYGYWGRVMPETGRQLLEGELFTNTPPLIVVACLLAWVWGITRSAFYIRTLAVFCLLNVMLGSETARHALSHSMALSFFEDMQAERLVATGKLGCFLLLAGWAGTTLHAWLMSYRMARLLVSLRRWVWPQTGHSHSVVLAGIARDHARLALGMIVAVPLVLTAGNLIHAIYRWHIAPTDHLMFSVPANPFDWDEAIALREALNAQAGISPTPEELVQEPFPSQRALAIDGWKIASFSGEMGLAVFAPNYIPAVVLGTRPLFENEWLADRANIGWVIQQKNNPRPQWTTWGEPSLVYENEEFELWKRSTDENRGWFVSGEADIQRLERDGEAIRFEVRGTRPGDFVRFALSRYRKWQVTLNGETVDTLLAQQHGEPEEAWKLIGFPVQDGIIELRYARSLIDVASGWASLVVLALAGLIAGFWPWLHSFRTVVVSSTVGGRIRVGLMIPVACLLVVPLIPLAPENAPEVSPRITYVGNSRDQVGELYGRPDGRNDLLFELDVLVDPQWGKLKEISLARQELDPGDQYLKWWSTRTDGLWHIGVLDARGRRIDAIHGTVRLSRAHRQPLILFATNPYNDAIPVPLKVTCTLRFENHELVVTNSMQ